MFSGLKPHAQNNPTCWISPIYNQSDRNIWSNYFRVSSRLSEERISQKLAKLYLCFFKGTFHNFQEEYWHQLSALLRLINDFKREFFWTNVYFKKSQIKYLAIFFWKFLLKTISLCVYWKLHWLHLRLRMWTQPIMTYFDGYYHFTWQLKKKLEDIYIYSRTINLFCKSCKRISSVQFLPTNYFLLLTFGTVFIASTKLMYALFDFAGCSDATLL